MIHARLADLVVVLHLAFILFVALGGLLVFWKPWLASVHLPVALYGVLIEWVGWVCPLTPLENRLRWLAGEAGYDGGFVEHYLLPIIYPRDFTETTAMLLGALVLLANAIIYGTFLWRRFGA